VIDLCRELERKERRKAVPGGWPRLWNLPRGWLHQGFLYQDRTQQVARALLEIGPTCLCAWAFSALFDVSLHGATVWVYAMLVSHSLNWVFNHNWWAEMLFTFPSLRNPGPQKTALYLKDLADRLSRSRSISGVLLFGSLSRGAWHDRSDLDMRILRRPGILNGVRAVCAMMRERFLALLAHQPLDVYLADDVVFLEKMRQDETPVFLVKRDERLERRYPGIPARDVRGDDLGGRSEPDVGS